MSNRRNSVQDKMHKRRRSVQLLQQSSSTWYHCMASLLLLTVAVNGNNLNTHHPRVDWSESPFSIIIDGGSTGSRLHIFEFVSKPPADRNDHAQHDSDNDGNVTSALSSLNSSTNTVDMATTNTATECVRRGSSRVDVPLSSFGRLSAEQDMPINATQVADHILPLFEYAASVIPSQYHNSTRVLYQATAGMRLLDVPEQHAVYDAMYDGLMQSPDFAFRNLQRSDLQTLSGELEGFYGAIAVNYLKGVIDTKLQLVEDAVDDDDILSTNTVYDGDGESGSTATKTSSETLSSMPIGALDMGGSSTQIVFTPVSAEPRAVVVGDDSERTCATNYDYTSDENACVAPDALPPISQQSTLREDDFFKTSYLSYGVDQFRERMFRTWIAERQELSSQRSAGVCDGQQQQCANDLFILNPCSNPGYEQEYNDHVFVGTGETDRCIEQIRRFIPHPTLPLDGMPADLEHERTIGGIQHPPIRGKFMAMSLYFFALDSLRVFSKDNAVLQETWPTPTINELRSALDGMCSRSWHDDFRHLKDDHPFTGEHALPHRCMESAYMVTLLKDGYGFDPDARDITFTFLVDDSEVEWTLGMALAMHSESQGRQSDAEADIGAYGTDGVGQSNDELMLTGTTVEPERSNVTRSTTRTDGFVSHSTVHTLFYPESL